MNTFNFEPLTVKSKICRWKKGKKPMSYKYSTQCGFHYHKLEKECGFCGKRVRIK